MDLIKKLIDLIFYYQKDKADGRPYWKDPAVIGLVVSLAATELYKLYGLNLDADLQLKIVGVVTGVGALFSPHTGIVEKSAPVKPSAMDTDQLRELARQVQAANRADPTTTVDHGGS